MYQTYPNYVANTTAFSNLYNVGSYVKINVSCLVTLALLTIDGFRAMATP